MLEKLENVSKNEAIKILEQETGVSVKSQDAVRPLSDGTYEVKSVLTKDVLTQLDKAKGLLAHTHPKISHDLLLNLALKALLEKIDPSVKAQRALKRAEDKMKKDSSSASAQVIGSTKKSNPATSKTQPLNMTLNMPTPAESANSQSFKSETPVPEPDRVGKGA